MISIDHCYDLWAEDPEKYQYLSEYLPAPEWAVGLAEGLEPGAQLPTRDGRCVGNAHILEVVHSVTAEGQISQYRIVTDAGSKMLMERDEVEERFYQPKYVSDIDEVIRFTSNKTS